MPSHSNTVVETPFSQEKIPSDDYPQKFVLRVVGAIAIAHLLNDSIQAVVTASYPMLKAEFSLSFAQIGWIALVYQITASLLQPWVGLYTDKHPKPYLLPAGMGVTLVGIGLIAIASNFQSLLIAAALIGVGSSTFHPEASRIARTASGGRFGTAQSMFQVGGNTGSALGPLVAAAVIIPNGQGAIGLFVVVAALAIYVLLRVTKWLLQQAPVQGVASQQKTSKLTRHQVIQAMSVICVLMFAKFIYIAAITNYFTFYLIERFNVSIQTSQLYLFIFLGAVALGTFVGGPVGDRIGRKAVVWVSFLGVAPFALMLPYVGLTGTAVLTVIIGLVMSSAFSALVVYAQEAVPGRVGMIAGLMFGLMFGIGGVGAAGLGHLADTHGIVWVYKLCSFLPLLGFMTALLPNIQQK
ncbi:MFS transporter [Acinetobacter bereziniae]|uniref:MFS transporter n=1 Tax=Acinetobacter bereziniae TaxID=106648 RepID=UPI001905F8F5|nr:MFS transporter [Acinetobacter bereziniae]MDG3555460.1 MFS transporter [Acinetobacter bereziniae]MDP6001843.1 MFS transporter [Acinetobacter bereziniae]QQC82129.1 MFS transporter [Acinetobacter bereziniae]UUN95254.1 MFS transporter [Acinetobacter bereziniae]WMW76202.1 MFS transporter [Acinetobacter bereziniae]